MFAYVQFIRRLSQDAERGRQECNMAGGKSSTGWLESPRVRISLKAAEVSDAAASQAELLSEAWKVGTHPSVWTLDSHPGALKGCFQTRSRVYIPGTIVPLPVLLETGSLEDWRRPRLSASEGSQFHNVGIDFCLRTEWAQKWYSQQRPVCQHLNFSSRRTHRIHLQILRRINCAKLRLTKTHQAANSKQIQPIYPALPAMCHAPE